MPRDSKLLVGAVVGNRGIDTVRPPDARQALRLCYGVAAQGGCATPKRCAISTLRAVDFRDATKDSDE